MSLTHPADLDRSLLRTRLAQHDLDEAGLGSLPDALGGSTSMGGSEFEFGDYETEGEGSGRDGGKKEEEEEEEGGEESLESEPVQGLGRFGFSKAEQILSTPLPPHRRPSSFPHPRPSATPRLGSLPPPLTNDFSPSSISNSNSNASSPYRQTDVESGPESGREPEAEGQDEEDEEGHESFLVPLNDASPESDAQKSPLPPSRTSSPALPSPNTSTTSFHLSPSNLGSGFGAGLSSLPISSTPNPSPEEQQILRDKRRREVIAQAKENERLGLSGGVGSSSRSTVKPRLSTSSNNSHGSASQQQGDRSSPVTISQHENPSPGQTQNQGQLDSPGNTSASSSQERFLASLSRRQKDGLGLKGGLRVERSFSVDTIRGEEGEGEGGEGFEEEGEEGDYSQSPQSQQSYSSPAPGPAFDLGNGNTSTTSTNLSLSTPPPKTWVDTRKRHFKTPRPSAHQNHRNSNANANASKGDGNENELSRLSGGVATPGTPVIAISGREAPETVRRVVGSRGRDERSAAPTGEEGLSNNESQVGDHVDDDGQYAQTPRIPSLTRSSEAGNTSDGDSVEMTRTPEPLDDDRSQEGGAFHSQAAYVTPARGLRRSVGFGMGMTPSIVGGMSNLGIVPEEEGESGLWESEGAGHENGNAYQAGPSSLAGSVSHKAASVGMKTPGSQYSIGRSADQTRSSQYATPGVARHLSRGESPADRSYMDEEYRDEDIVDSSLPEMAASQLGRSQGAEGKDITLPEGIGMTPRAMGASRFGQSPLGGSHLGGGGGDISSSHMQNYMYTALDSNKTSTRRRSLVASTSIKRGRVSSGSSGSATSRDVLATPEMEQREDAFDPRTDHSLAQSMNRSGMGQFQQRLLRSVGGQSESDGESNQSFVSIASSADLTSDRRGGSSRSKMNTSLPAVRVADLGTHEDRAQSAKIAKHVSEMNAHLTQENRQLLEQVEMLQEQLADQAFELEQKEDGLATPKRDRSTGNVSVDRVGQVAKKNDEIIQLLEQVHKLEDQVRSKDSEIAGFRSRRSTTPPGNPPTALLSEADVARILELEAERDRYRFAESQLRAELCAAEEHQETIKKQMQEENAEMERQFAETLSGEERLREQLAKSRAEVQSLTWEKGALEKEKERLRQIMESPDVEEKERASQALIGQLQDEVRTLHTQHVEQQSQIQSLEADLNTQIRVGETWQHRAVEAESNLDVVRQQVKQEQSKAADLELANKVLDAEKHEQGRQLETVRTSLQDEKQALKNALQDLDECEQVVEDAQVRCDKAAFAQEEAEEVAVRLQAEVDNAREQLSVLRKELDSQLQQSASATSKVDSLEAALATAQASLRDFRQKAGTSIDDMSMSSARSGAGSRRADSSLVDALEGRLAKAQQEIEELRRVKSTGSIEQQVALNAKDAKIMALMTERDLLHQRMRSPKADNTGSWTPQSNTSGLMAAGSPFSGPRFLNKHLANVKAPQTPQTPGMMPEHSFLDMSTNSGAERSLLAKVQELEVELQQANKRVDNNINRLENANLTTWTMADQLAAEHEKVLSLEAELDSLRSRLERSVNNLIRTKCPGCDIRFDASKAVESTGAETSMFGDNTPRPKKTNSVDLQETVRSLRRQYQQLQDQLQEDRQLNEIQQREISRLRQDARTAEGEVAASIEATEARLEEEFRTLKQENFALKVEMESVQRRLEQTNLNLTESRTQNRKAQQQLKETKAQLGQVEKQCGLLGADCAGLKESLESAQKRLNQHTLATSRRDADLQDRATQERDDALQKVERLKSEVQELERICGDKEAECIELESQLHEQKRAQQSVEAQLISRTDARRDLQRNLRQVETALKSHKAEAEDFSRTIAKLQQDREKQQVDSVELHALRRNRSESEKMIDSLEEQIRELERSLKATEQEVARRSPNHMSGSERQEALKVRVTDLVGERKKLTAQIRYLKAKFAREDTFRSALVVQKHYLLRLVGQFRQTEKETLSLIASIGYPTSPRQPPPRRTFKAVATAVLCLVRARRAAQQWSHETAQRDQMLESHRSSSSRSNRVRE